MTLRPLVDRSAVAGGRDVVLPGHLARPVKAPDRPVVKPELREFAGLGEARAGSGRKKLLFVCLGAGVAAVANLLFFAYPRIVEVRADIPGITRVEISTDGGATWADAKLDPQASKYAWRRFRSSWMPTAAGDVRILSRATNAKGETQTTSLWNRSGYQRNVVEGVDIVVS